MEDGSLNPSPELLAEVARSTEGDLAKVPYALLLRALWEHRKSCVLEIRKGPMTKSIVLEDGVPVDCESNMAHERLGRFLVSQGKLSLGDADSCLQDSVCEEVPLGQVLVRRGYVDEEALPRVLQQNLAKKLLDGFSWSVGSYEICDVDGDVENPLRVKVHQLILTGLTRFASQERIDLAVMSLLGRRLARSVETSGVSLDELRLSGEQQRVLWALAEGPHHLSDLAGKAQVELESLTRMVYAFGMLGLIGPEETIGQNGDSVSGTTEVPADTVPVPVTDSDGAPRGVPAASGPPPTAESAAAAATMTSTPMAGATVAVQDLAPESAPQTAPAPPAPASPPPEAPAAEGAAVGTATEAPRRPSVFDRRSSTGPIEKTRRSMHPAASKSASDDSMVLSMVRPRRGASKAAIADAHKTHRRKDAFDLLEVEESATPRAVEEAFLAWAERMAPWEVPITATDLRDQASDLFLAGARAYAELFDRESRERLVANRRAREEQERSERQKRRVGPQRIQTDLLDPEAQFTKGMALVEAGSFEEAIQYLDFAADCDPQNGTYRSEAAWARYRSAPRHAQEALGMLEEARRIDPNCGLGYYYAGEILRETQRWDSAEELLQAAIKPMAPDRRPIEALKQLQKQSKRKRR